MLKTRILTVAILLPFLLWAMLFGPQIVMFFVVMAAMCLSVYEMVMMLQPRLDDVMRNYVRFDPVLAKEREEPKQFYSSATRPDHYQRLAIACSAVMALLFIASAVVDLGAGRGILVLVLMLTMLAGVFATRGIEAEMARVLGFTLALVYAGCPWLIVWDLYTNETGSKQLVLTLAVVWLGDTGGYFGGRFFGKHKLAPNKSPKKTWEGAIAGLLASIMAALVLKALYYPEIPGGFVATIACGFFGGIAGQMGDLVESVFKRFTLVKDSGTILPGHGGILDRMDAVLFAAPVIWMILSWSQLGIAWE